MLLNCGVGEDLRVPWTARRSNQSILKEISPEYSLEGLTLQLKLQYFGHLMQRTDSLEKALMLGKIEGRRRGQQRMRWLDGITDSMDMSLLTLGVGDGQGGLVCCSPWGRKESDTTEQLNWTELWKKNTKIKNTAIQQGSVGADIWQKPTQNCKAIILQLKIFYKRINKQKNTRPNFTSWRLRL